jgi:hypothetical protein
MIIAAFDLATATGVCDGPVGGKPRLFSWYLADGGDTRPARLHSLHGFLDRYFAKCECDAVVYEAPMPIGMLVHKPSAKKGPIMSEANVAFARGAIGVLEERCFAHGKQCESASVQDARSSVLGWRTNRGETDEATKARVVREVTKIHRVPAESDNEADSWVIWQYACNLQNPRLAVMQTPLFRGTA